MKVIAFKVEIDGVEVAIKNQDELAAAVKLAAQAFKKADFGSDRYKALEKTLASLKEAQKNVGAAATEAAREQQKAAKAAADAAEIASGSYKGLKLELGQLRQAYESLSAAERETAGPELLNQIARVKTALNQYSQDIRDTAREQTISADVGGRSYRALNAELVNLRRTYKELTEAERNTIGRPLLMRIDQLDKELKEIDASMGQYQRNVGNYSSAFQDLLGLDFAALATPAGAAIAIGQAAIQGAIYIKEMTAEVRALQGRIENFTNASGAELDGLTARVLAISETFNFTTDEVANAANSLAKQLGIPYDEALRRIEEASIAGLNANGELLESAREYGTFFAEAFGEGETAANVLFEVIRRGNEQGIFNDKAVDAVKEVTLRLREMTTTTSDALTAIGLSSEEVTALIGQEGIGAAIELVTGRLGTLQADSPEVGQALADIFGGAGEDAGLDFLVGLQDITKASGDLIDTTSEYQRQQQRTLEVNKQFAAAQVEVANAFGETGSSIDNITTQGQTLLLRLAVPFIEYFQELGRIFSPLVESLLKLGRSLGLVGPEMDAVGTFTKTLTSVTKFLLKPLEAAVFVVSKMTDAYTGLVERAKGVAGFFGFTTKAAEGAATAQEQAGAGAEKAGAGYEDAAAKAKTYANNLDGLKKKLADLEKQRNSATIGGADFTRLTKEIQATEKTIDSYGNKTKSAAVATEKFAKDSVGFLRAELSKLNKDLVGATGANETSILADIIGVEKAIAEIEEGRGLLRRALARVGQDLQPTLDLNAQRIAEGFQPAPEGTIAAVTRTGDAVKAELEKQSKNYDEIVRKRVAKAEEAARLEIEAEERKAARIAEISGAVFSSFNSINGQLAQGSSVRAQNEIADVTARYEAEIEAAEGNAERQQELREQLAEAQEEIREKELAQQKKYRIASALAALAEGTVNILSTPTTIPDPFGAIFKAVQIGFLATSTALQISNIKKQRVAAKGMLVGGKIRGDSHQAPSGGVSLLIGGQQILAENGENVVDDGQGGVAIINRRSSTVFADELKRYGNQNFAGKREWLSGINSYKGFGVPFMREGGLVEPSLSSIAAVNQASTTTRVAGAVQLSEESVTMIAEATGRAVRQGSREGTAEGSAEAVKMRERQERLRKRTG